MPTTESEGGHPHPLQHQHQHTPASSFPARTHFSVADLLSRHPQPDPTYHHQIAASAPRPSVQRSLSRPTPTSPPQSAASAHPTWTTVNHAGSPQISPTTTQLPPIIADTAHISQKLPNFAAVSNPPLATSELSTSSHNAPHSLTPPNHRQDSGVFQQRIDLQKDVPGFSVSSDVKLLPPLRSPNGSLASTSPTSNSFPTTPPSPQSLNHVSFHSGMHSQPKNIANHHHSSHRTSAIPDAEFRGVKPGAAVDNTGAVSSRQQRYNVRFNQAYTPDNMPAQKPRPDHQTSVAASVGPVEAEAASPERPATPLSTQRRRSASSQIDEPFPDQLLQEESFAKRCEYCHEVWRRPIPTRDQYERNEQSAAKNTEEIAQNSMDLIAQLRKHGKQADAAYDRWCHKHRFCAPPAPAESSSPAESRAATDGQRSDTDASRRDSRTSDVPVNNKRKSDVPHENERTIHSKSRRVTFQAQKT